MAHYSDDEQYDPEEEYSPTSWDKDPNESQEDYEERVQALEDYLESLD